jgi:ParB-like chromosome segregation protein Spo0J
MASTASKQAIEEYIFEALGEGEHMLQVYSPGPPSLVIVNDFGQGDDGEHLCEVEVIDPASENNISLEDVWAHLEWRRLLRKYGWRRLAKKGKKAKKTLLSSLRPSPEIEELWAGMTTAEEDAALEASLTATGPVLPITTDEFGNIIDGHRCHRVYMKHGIREVFVTVLTDMTDEEKKHMAVRLNAHRRHLTVHQKQEVARKLLIANPRLSARYLGWLVGVDHHTSQILKNAMITGGEIPHLDEIEGRDGKTYKAKGAVTPLRDIKRTLKELSEVSELPGVVTPKKVRSQKAKERREQAAQKGAGMTDPANTRLVHCDFRDLLIREPGIEKAAGLGLTDPPYEAAWLPHWRELAIVAKRVLVPGGWLVTYAPNNHLDQVIAALSSQLRYVRTLSLPFKVGGNFSFYGGLRFYGMWRPILVFHNGTPENARIDTNIMDRLPFTRNEKDWHTHQQNTEDMTLLVKTFSLPGDLVVDFCGGGFTTAAACMKAGGRRRFVGCDILQECVDVGRYRLNLLANELPLP